MPDPQQLARLRALERELDTLRRRTRRIRIPWRREEAYRAADRLARQLEQTRREAMR